MGDGSSPRPPHPAGEGGFGEGGGRLDDPPFSAPHPQLAACRCGGAASHPSPLSQSYIPRWYPTPPLPPSPPPRGGRCCGPPGSIPVFIPVFPLPPRPAAAAAALGAVRAEAGGGDAGRGKCWGALAQPLETPPRLLPGLLGPCGLGSPGPPWIYPGHVPPFPLSQVRSEHQNLWGVPFCPERWGDWGSPPGFGVQPHPVFWGALGWGPFAAASPKRSVTVTGRGWEGPFGVRGPGGRLGPPPRAAAARRRPPGSG